MSATPSLDPALKADVLDKDDRVPTNQLNGPRIMPENQEPVAWYELVHVSLSDSCCASTNPECHARPSTDGGGSALIPSASGSSSKDAMTCATAIPVNASMLSNPRQ